MPRKQSSSEVSSIAGKYVRMTNAQFTEMVLRFYREYASLVPSGRLEFFRDIRKLAASVLAQDETKGKRK